MAGPKTIEAYDTVYIDTNFAKKGEGNGEGLKADSPAQITGLWEFTSKSPVTIRRLKLNEYENGVITDPISTYEIFGLETVNAMFPKPNTLDGYATLVTTTAYQNGMHRTWFVKDIQGADFVGQELKNITLELLYGQKDIGKLPHVNDFVLSFGSPELELSVWRITYVDDEKFHMVSLSEKFKVSGAQTLSISDNPNTNETDKLVTSAGVAKTINENVKTYIDQHSTIQYSWTHSVKIEEGKSIYLFNITTDIAVEINSVTKLKDLVSYIGHIIVNGCGVTDKEFVNPMYLFVNDGVVYLKYWKVKDGIYALGQKAIDVATVKDTVTKSTTSNAKGNAL